MNAIARREFLGGAAALGLSDARRRLRLWCRSARRRRPRLICCTHGRREFWRISRNSDRDGDRLRRARDVKHAMLTDRSAAGRAALAAAARGRVAIFEP